MGIQASTLLTVLGPILCLEIAPKARSSGVLLWAVVLMISALVIGANPVVNEVKFSHGYFHWTGMLTLFALPLFFVFFQRLARTLERPELERRARLILKLLAWCLAGIGMAVAGFYAGGAAALIQVAGALGVMVLYLAWQRWRNCRVGATHRPHTVCGGLHPPYKWLTSARARYSSAHFLSFFQADPWFAVRNHAPSVSEKRRLGASPVYAQTSSMNSSHLSSR